MKLKYIFISVLIILSSCSDVLVEAPENFVAPEQFFNTEQEAESAIYGVYDFLHDFNIGDFGHFDKSEMGTDIGNGRSELWRNGGYDIWEPDPNIWRVHYQAIGAANFVLNRVNASKRFSGEFKNRLSGEAKFLRAFYYYKLNMYWGNVPIWLDELNLDKAESLPNSSSVEVRQQIIADLNDAADLLPNSVSKKGRATAWMAKGLLARMYLFEKDWANAKRLALDIINNSGHRLLATHLKVFDYQNKFNSELIHVVPKLGNVKGGQMQTHASPRPFDDGPAIQQILNADPELKIVRPLDGVLVTDVSSRNPGGIFQGWGSLHCLKEHYDSYEPGDLRKNLIWHFITFTNGSKYEMTGGGSTGASLNGRSGYYPLKWTAFDATPNNGPRDIHFQRLAEVYLILAEAENELNGPTAEAYEAINRLRRRAFGDNSHDLSGLSKEQFKQAIIQENAWELANEGLRRYYLWHWGYDVFKQAVQSVAVSLPELAAKLAPHHQYWRIPSNELAKNPNLKQNPGY